MDFGKEFKKYAVKHRGISSLTTERFVSSIENMTRTVIEERPVNFREIDVFSRLMADRIIFMADGEIVEQNTPDEFFNNPKNDRTKTFLDQILI